MKRKLRKVPARTQQARADDDAAVRVSARRKLNTFLRFWKFCPRAECRRASGCSGDPHACFKLFWPHVPEEIKYDIRAMICKAAGKSEQADNYRRAAQEVRDAQAALTHTASASAAEPADPPRESHMPRIRVL